MKTIFLFLTFCSFNLLFAQVFTDADVKVLNEKFQLAKENNLKNEPINQIIETIGKSFLGVEYVAHTCEIPGEEQLVINLTGLDCTTYLENCLTISRCIKKDKMTFEDYKKELQFVRYRDGVINRYPSRLHYFSDWIFNNTAKGLVKDVTKEIKGDQIKFNVFFMSKNPDKYMHLTETPEFIKTIAEQEKEINSRTYYYIPNAKVKELEGGIETGDLIAIVTNIKGLDVGHVGIAVRMKDNRIHFMHAPLTGAKVQITTDPIDEYLMKVKKHEGIIVLRPVNP